MEGAKIIRLAQLKRGLNQKALAELSLTSRKTISNIETGKLIPDDGLTRYIAVALQIDYQQLQEAFWRDIQIVPTNL